MSVSKKLLHGIYGKISDEALGVQNALYEYNPGKCLLPELFGNYAQKIMEAPVREDDVWLISYPRTGSTWCQEMIWLIGNNLDFETASTTLQQIRAPLIELSGALHEFAEHFKKLFNNSLDYVNQLPSPRFIKSHLPIQLLPTEIHKVKPKSSGSLIYEALNHRQPHFLTGHKIVASGTEYVADKIIYTMRHPKDLCVSYYYYFKLIHGFCLNFDTFCELFLNDQVAYGGVFNHYLEFWKRRNEKNFLILRYEDMKRDTEATVRDIANFLEKPLSDGEIKQIGDFLSFQKMRKNKGCNGEILLDARNGNNYFERMGLHFIRKGEVGDWRNHMSPEMSKRFDEWIKINTAGTDLSFD